ncbi:DUF2726 domain-containing protein [Sphingomonas sp. RIT328]|uniref:DUF2726 domain-containing protein n=1 Tax=Sphingomonas sp. RIT328 TaxID=1470591 RepID=UPI00044DAB07|nr:DUF2726 domain-containing protein [Sphingomonas sp. RIT328]EZP51336.1 hypothetical protein BW41_02767 [Sphingomonas sp. RIT328]
MNVTLIIAIGIVFLFLSVGLKLATTRQTGRSGPAPVAKPFLSAREAAMLDVLEQLLPHCRIHAQVAMGALLEAPRVAGRKRRPADRNAFAQKIVDFVAQDRTTGAILALIEVDDRSHKAARDLARDAMTSKAGYRTVRIPAGTKPTLAAVEAVFAAALPARDVLARGQLVAVVAPQNG